MRQSISRLPPAIDGTRGEARIYENILAAYQCTLASGKDRVATGSRIAAIIARLMKEGGEGCAGTTKNGLLLLLALFFLQDTQMGLQGQDITTLDPRERDRLLVDLGTALPGA